ncbi:hypothetical protein IscW_ISCW012608 [Ixodes scapularis]|uniref:Uncharacterized protein n=1 Tax=Ixodes scapularis TaxID=6945 RepID=B7QD18_IXOSC|nr:hypothetical protein IscW_ISCW012608 [Ixodes scapularis]|eukprot:XP_002413432.1 hypothetical protein IscW_ISCW012608 [Ixodes scapularis]
MREGSLTLACLARRRPRRFSSLLFSPLAGAFQFSGLLAEGDRRRNQRPRLAGLYERPASMDKACIFSSQTGIG